MQGKTMSKTVSTMKIPAVSPWVPLICLALSLVVPARAEGFLRARGDRIVDGEGREVLLRGMGLGGLMLQGGYMLRLKGENPLHRIRQRIVGLIGPGATDRF